jgi:ubiquinone/menaquinone biosynthesis C-methylase UbiE
VTTAQRGSAKTGVLRLKQVSAWIILGVFAAGFFVGPIGLWTGPILGAWFVGTQRLRRGFLWMLAFSVAFALPHLVIHIAHTAASGALAYAGWTLATLIAGILPFTFYRMVALQFSGFIATLALPLPAVVIAAVMRLSGSPAAPTAHAGNLDSLPSIFLSDWTAAVLIWAWNHEFRVPRIAAGVSAFAVGAGALLGLGVLLPPQLIAPVGTALVWVCSIGTIALAVSALIFHHRHRGSHYGPDILWSLLSPATGASLHLACESGCEMLASSAGESFPIRDGIADLRSPEDLSGLNKKYNRLYDTIGGFYDDIQRVVCALQGFDRDAYVMSYLSLFEVKKGDSVLETSVGTGLNFKYLPRGTRLCGLDLSSEMLGNCRANLQRWQLQGDLFLGNAEHLPFADESFDVVFHVGGINFFNDRARAIREMIRVAKPGSRILIADETEEHVKAAYERGPVTSGYYKDRKEPVKPPIDLVPPEMKEIHLEILTVVGKNRFYALTFRKPTKADNGAVSLPQNKSGIEWNAMRVGAAL